MTSAINYGRRYLKIPWRSWQCCHLLTSRNSATAASLASDARVRHGDPHTPPLSANLCQNQISNVNTYDSTRSEGELRRRIIHKTPNSCQRERRTRPLGLRRNRVPTIHGKLKLRSMGEPGAPTIELLNCLKVSQARSFPIFRARRPLNSPSPINHNSPYGRPTCQRRQLRPGRSNRLCMGAHSISNSVPICPLWR